MSAHTEHTFGGHAMDRHIFEFEVSEGATAADTPVGDEVSTPTGADGADGGQAAAADSGAAGDAAPPAPAAPEIDWTSPGAQEAMESFLAQREAAAAEQARHAEAAAQQASEFDDIKEAFSLLGIDTDRFDAFLNARLGNTVAPLAEAAQQFQAEQSMKQITAHLEQLGTQHPDLLGDGIGKLAEITGDDGQPLFNPDQVREQNQSAVISTTVGILEASKDASGNPTIPWTVAAEHAAKAVADRDAVMKRIGVEEFKRQMTGTAGAAVDVTGTGTGGAQRLTGVEGGDELTVARRFAQEHGLR